MTALSDTVAAAVREQRDSLLDISHQIHARPELGFQETFAHGLLTDYLEGLGFDVTRSACDLETAFIAEIGDGPGPTVGVLCEYDALPEIGHGCGHNIIAAVGVGAAAAAARVIAQGMPGRVRILGTPAEESGGGKVYMLERGAFEGLSATMMVHPASRDLTEMRAVAIERLRIDYLGLAAHASAAPELGRNALDAAVLGYINVAALRQHLLPHERVHGIITGGGTRANIVPEHSQAEWYIRSPSVQGLSELVERVRACLSAGADAAMCAFTEEQIGRPYMNLLTDPYLIELYVDAAATVGRTVEIATEETQIVGSTDMGNVSQVLPSIHPMIKCAPDGVSLHTPDFAQYVGGPEGDRAVIDGASAIGLTVAKVLAASDAQESWQGQHSDSLI